MYNATETVDFLKSKGIQFSHELTEEEIRGIETIYDIEFPKSLRSLYIHGIPYTEKDNCFPRWTDYSEANISEIKQRIEAPYNWLLESVLKGFWLPAWGERPKEQDEITKCFNRLTEKAPRLVPIYSHRYMPQLDMDNPPVISTIGRDTIYYGSDLRDYLKHEFDSGSTWSSDADFAYIPFWSDIMNYND